MFFRMYVTPTDSAQVISSGVEIARKPIYKNTYYFERQDGEQQANIIPGISHSHP